MTWAVWLPMIIFGLIKIVVTCLPSGTVNWLLGKFETHTKLKEEEVTVTINGKRLEGKDKSQIIHSFNEALFLKQYTVFPGYEQAYLQPENGGTPIVMEMKEGRRNVKAFVFTYHDHVDVVKQFKKKIVAYRLSSDSLQKHVPPGA